MLDYAQLAALAAVIHSGSFEKAAARLNITPSAVSQRIRLLEERMGVILVVRGQPCTATPAGQRLCRHAGEVGVLEAALRADLSGVTAQEDMALLRIAINADSLATWFPAAMAGAPGVLFDIVLDDQDHSADWLRRGEVCAAVSAQGARVQGCDARPLGVLRYCATASPAFAARWFAEGVSAETLARAPAITFNAKDGLQTAWVRALLGRDVALPTHWLPASQAFVDGALCGIGWGMNPEPLVARHLAEGRLVDLVPGRVLDVALHWHWSRAAEPALRPVASAVIAAARRALVPHPG